MAYPTFLAGQRLTAGMLTEMQWREVEQGEDQIVNNTTTLVDTNLVVPVVAGARYRFRLFVGYNSGETPDISFAWSVPSGGAVTAWTWGLGVSGTGAISDYTSVQMRRPATTTVRNVGGSGTANAHSYHEEGILSGGVGGNITFQFAQFVADPSDTEIFGASRIDYLRIE